MSAPTKTQSVLELNRNWGVDAPLSPYEFTALSEGRWLDALRLYRNRRGVGLAEAKAAVEVTLMGGTPKESAP